MNQIAVIIPSLGRAPLLARTIDYLGRQSRPADKVVVVGVDASDVAGVIAPRGMDLDIVLSEKGSSKQRNRALQHIGGSADIIVFFDDDFLPAPNYLAELEALFAEQADLAGATGQLIDDGVVSEPISFDNAAALIARHEPSGQQLDRPLRALYGCNMGFRSSALEGIWFDEQLPLYGWQEDVDFSFRAAAWGRVVKSSRLTGVHMGTRSGRTSGRRFGYSQIANPIYLLKKGTIPTKLAYRLLFRNMAANIALSFWPEPHVDRRGRLWGNIRALFDLARGALHPTRVLNM